MTSLLLAPVLAARVPARWRRSWRWISWTPTSVRAFSHASCQTWGRERAALLAGEDVAVVARLSEGVEVAA